MTNTNLATVIPFYREKSSLHSLEVDGTEVQKFIKKPPISTKMECLYNEEQIRLPYDAVVLTIEPTSFKGSQDVDIYAKYYGERYHMATYGSMDRAVSVVKDIYSSFDNKKYYTMYTI